MHILDIPDIPDRIGYLILLYMHKAINPTQHDELDAWVEASEENIRIFEELTSLEKLTY